MVVLVPRRDYMGLFAPPLLNGLDEQQETA